MRDFKRAIHFDFHTVGGIEEFLRDFSAKDFAETLQKANVKYINFFAACNNGFCYYPTKTGIIYPTLKYDLLGEVIKECHARDIGVTAYINVGLNHEQAVKHPSWSRVDENGRSFLTDGNLIHDCDKNQGNIFTKTMCFNNAEYIDYILNIVKEIASYDIDGLFCDAFYPEICFCPTCMAKMQKEGVDTADLNAVMSFQAKATKEFAEKIRAELGNGKYLFFNGMDNDFKINTHAEIESLPSWSWRHYEFFTQHAAYLRNVYDKRVYMTGRFQRDWGDFGGIRPRAALEYDLFDALSAGYQVSYGDHMDPIRGVNKDMFKVIGDIFQKAKEYEPFTDNTDFISETAILTHNYDELDSLRYRAASRLLTELNIPFDCVNPSMDFSKYKLIVVPDEFAFDTALSEKFEKFIANGGKVLTSGSAGLNVDKSAFALKEYSFIDFCGIDDSKRAYFKLNKGFGDYDANSIWSVYYYQKPDGTIGGTALKMKNNGGTEIASYLEAYFGKMKQGVHGCYYTPPKDTKGYSYALSNGKVAHIGFDVFANYGTYFLQAQKELVKQAIDSLLPERLIKNIDIPSTTKLSLTGKKEYDLLHVKVTYPEHRNFRAIIEEHNVLEEGKSLLIKGNYKSAKLLPSGVALSTKTVGNYLQISLPRIVGYAMIQLQK